MEITARVTADAVVNTTRSDKQVVNFTVAINDSYRPSGSNERKEITTYIRCSYWVNAAVAQYLTKGKLVELHGRPGVNAYVSREGEAKANLTFHVSNIKLHGGGTKSNNAQASATPVVPIKAETPDDLPF